MSTKYPDKKHANRECILFVKFQGTALAKNMNPFPVENCKVITQNHTNMGDNFFLKILIIPVAHILLLTKFPVYKMLYATENDVDFDSLVW